MGPIDIITIDGEVAELSIVGQGYKTSAKAASSYSVGDYVVVAADAEGKVGVLYSEELGYVPGASPVMVRPWGQIQSADASRARLSVGTAVLDYSAHLAVDPSFAPVSARLIEARGDSTGTRWDHSDRSIERPSIERRPISAYAAVSFVKRRILLFPRPLHGGSPHFFAVGQRHERPCPACCCVRLWRLIASSRADKVA